MMEIGEAYSIAKQLKEEITGKKIKKVEVGYSPHKFAFFSEDINIYNEIVNSIVDDIYSVGGYVEMKLDKYRLILGEGVSLRYLDKNQKLPEKHQLCIIFDDDSKIICSVQMYGVMMVFKEDEFDNIYYQAANKFPSPLTEEFSLEYFKEIYTNTKKSLSIKAFLATEQRIPGLGNGTLQDILFVSGINPQTKIKALSNEDLEKIYFIIKSTIKDISEKKGRDIEKDIYGNKGSYKTILSNKTYKQPCPKCKGDIIKKSYLGGTVYFCPNCQPVIS